MLKKFPVTFGEYDRSLPSELLDAVMGQRIEAVTYRMPGGVRWSDEYRHEGVHEVDMGVALSLSNQARLDIDWAMDGFTEGLALEVFQGEDHESDHLESIDVSMLPEWGPYLGGAIRGVYFSKFVADERAATTAWSVKLELDDGTEFAIALGELVDGEPQYMPDNLVVITNPSIGRAYRVVGSDQSAWSE